MTTKRIETPGWAKAREYQWQATVMFQLGCGHDMLMHLPYEVGDYLRMAWCRDCGEAVLMYWTSEGWLS